MPCYNNIAKVIGFLFLSITLLFLLPITAFAATPEMIFGTVKEHHSIGSEILRALRTSLFVVMSVVCLKAIKLESKIAISQIIWLCCIGILSMTTYNTERYIGVPDFSYFSTLAFVATAIGLFASMDYLRRLMTPEHNIALFDNVIIVSAILLTSLTALISIGNPALAADILIVFWCASIVLGSVTTIFMIISKKAEADLTLIGWVIAQVGLIFALGVGQNGGVIANLTSVLSWSAVILAHIFLSILTYARAVNHEKLFQGALLDKTKHNDPINLIVDKPAFRYLKSQNKVILNEECAKLLYISGRKSTFSLDAFKGLILPDHHTVIDLMINHKIEKSEKIKFHSCKQHGFIVPVKMAYGDGLVETIYLYQDADTTVSDMQKVDTIKVETSQKIDKIFTDRRHASDMMYFIDESIHQIDTLNHKNGDYQLLLLKVRFCDDWQAILGIAKAHLLLKEVTDTIRTSLDGFDALVCKYFGGDLIGIFCHTVGSDNEIERIKSIIHKRFEAPIKMEDFNIFISFYEGSSKTNAAEIKASDKQIMLGSMIDTAKREINNIKQCDPIDDTEITIPQGANILSLSSDLRYAPERSQINVHYAPIIDLKKGNVTGFNIEPIWRHPQYGVIQEGLLKYCAMRCDMENTIDRLVIAKAIEGMVKLYRSKKMPSMSFEISRTRLLKSNLDEEIQALCDLLKINASLIRLEFEADCLAHNAEWLANILKDLKNIGVTTVLQGFGSSEGQIASLSSLAFDRVIVDSDFSNKINNNERKFFALQSLVTMLTNMGIKVDIKNVADKESFKPLFDAGISNISGSAVGEGLVAERAVKLLTKNYEVF